ncbi:TRAP transporter substrate-binding protein [Arenibacterium sp. LLYu02]|uniref:TRAP transporter substrate-binding protein n=1 Tax=Arenibacterium sp. LLYu02 TaxID=3404132 RepID=UPI003B21F5FC
MLTFRTAQAALVAGAFALFSQAAAATELKLAHFVPPTHIITPSIVEPLATGVAEGSGGALTVKVFPAGELGAGPVEQYVRALQGIADIVWGVTGYTSSQFERTMVAELPGVFQGRSGAKVLHGTLDSHLAQEFPGTHPLALWTAEPNVLIMRDKEVRSPADLKGLRIRVAGSAPAQMVEALGGTPVQMSAAEGYNALQNGLIDGCLTGATTMADFRYDEVAEYLILGADLGHVGFFLTMNQAAYEGLPAEEKAALDAASGLALGQSGENGWGDHAEAVIAALRSRADRHVVDLSDSEIAAFNQITHGVRDSIIADMDARGLDGSAVLAAMQDAAQ